MQTLRPGGPEMGSRSTFSKTLQIYGRKLRGWVRPNFRVNCSEYTTSERLIHNQDSNSRHPIFGSLMSGFRKKWPDARKTNY